MKPRFRVRRYQVLLAIVGFIAVVVTMSYAQLQRGLPSVTVGQIAPDDASAGEAKLDLPWPIKGGAAVGIGNAGIVAVNKADRPQPIASVTKVMTAYVVMKDHPLRPGDLGPKIRVEAEDLQLYRQQLNNGESVVPVTPGTEITQYELLAGVLVPSGNNLAFLLARWSSGSVEAFVARMNEEAAALGMKNTRYADPSGLSPLSVSTAEDQLILAEKMMSDPVLAGVVGLKQIQLPGAGLLYNVNSLLGQDNLIGLKTGWTEEANACFVFAADWPVEGWTVRIYGAVFGQDTLAEAFAASRRLLASMAAQVRIATVVAPDVPSASLSTAWGTRAIALPRDEVRVVVWPGLEPAISLEAPPSLAKVNQGDEVGQLVVTAGTQRIAVPVIAQGSLGTADFTWRLTRAPALP